MFFCAKKVMYLSLYEQGRKVTGAGFASLQGEGDETFIKVQVRDAGRQQNGIYSICIIAKEQEISIGRIEVKRGCGSYEKSFSMNLEKIDIIQIKLNEDRIIASKWRQTTQKTEQIQQITESVTENHGEMEDMKAAEATGKNLYEREVKTVSVFPDKWEQLKNQYQTIHPFGDEREFITIEPKDFVILREASQRLVNNSFLLHGFYNYRHLILGRDDQLGSKGNVCFYIGVPGVFFEREKMVAVMFGFEGFESAGPVEIGKFGYYLRRVEI